MSPLANACFSLSHTQRSLQGQELYAGILRRSVTNWNSDARGIDVPLYRSPDASYTLRGTFYKNVYSGEGLQSFCCGVSSPRSFFRAVRVAGPDLGKCL
jgi:hypothetical protein